MVRFATDVSRQVAAAHGAVQYNHIAAITQLESRARRVVRGRAHRPVLRDHPGHVLRRRGGEDDTQELYDVLGHQRGWEILTEGVDDPPIVFPPFLDFSLALARDGVELAGAPPLPTLDREATVVTDPHYNTLVSHEIIGHPVELDRALKMETAYAGRSWLLRRLDDHQVGKPVASPLVTAYSDPSLPGYGHYKYDHEGTPARRVVHIDRGIFTGFMNSRQTAAIFGGVAQRPLTRRPTRRWSR